MSSKHLLSLEIPEHSNLSFIRIIDASRYEISLDATCGMLEIKMPGFEDPVILDVLIGFNKFITACDLGIQKEGCGTKSEAIPDGLYQIRYSVSPNQKVFVEYDYLRITKTLNDLALAYAQIDVAECDPCEQTTAKLKDLDMIDSFLKIAKAKVEVTFDTNQGLNVMRYAQDRLKKYTDSC